MTPGRRRLSCWWGSPWGWCLSRLGYPGAEVLGRLREAGSEGWVTVTNPGEAEQAEAAGADVLIAQGLRGRGASGDL